MGILDQLQKGDILTGLRLRATTGDEVDLGALRGRRNLALLLAHRPGCDPCAEMLRNLEGNLDLMRGEDADVMAIVPGDPAEVERLVQRLALSFPVLLDPAALLHDDAAIIVTDRFGEIFATVQAGKDHRLPAVGEIAGELAYIGVQCPE